jgi:hypothetical protein
MTQTEYDETRLAALAYMNGETGHVAPTAAESAKEAAVEKDATLRVAWILNQPAEKWKQEDRDFLSAEILKGIQRGF